MCLLCGRSHHIIQYVQGSMPVLSRKTEHKYVGIRFHSAKFRGICSAEFCQISIGISEKTSMRETGEPEEDRQKRIARRGSLEQNRQKRFARTGSPEKDRQEWITRPGFSSLVSTRKILFTLPRPIFHTPPVSLVLSSKMPTPTNVMH
jgi:hypothetical protein